MWIGQAQALGERLSLNQIANDWGWHKALLSLATPLSGLPAKLQARQLVGIVKADEFLRSGVWQRAKRVAGKARWRGRSAG